MLFTSFLCFTHGDVWDADKIIYDILTNCQFSYIIRTVHHKNVKRSTRKEGVDRDEKNHRLGDGAVSAYLNGR